MLQCRLPFMLEARLDGCKIKDFPGQLNCIVIGYLRGEEKNYSEMAKQSCKRAIH